MPTSSAPNEQTLTLTWKEGLSFQAETPSGGSISFNALDETAVSPLETLVASAAACSAMDVISILVKKRLPVTSYHVEVTWDRNTTGEWPHPLTAITITHILSGEGLDPEAVRHSVELSDDKYCTVIATLRSSPTITSNFKIV